MQEKKQKMLKIKDNIPLKELEKLGFEYEDFYDTYEFSVSASVMQVKKDRRLTLEGDVFDEKEGTQYLNVIYSLIKADMVEKVED